MLTDGSIFLLSFLVTSFFLRLVSLSRSLFKLPPPRSAEVFSIYWDQSLSTRTLNNIMPEPIKRWGRKEWTLSSSRLSRLFLVRFRVSLWQTTHGAILTLFRRGLAWCLLNIHWKNIFIIFLSSMWLLFEEVSFSHGVTSGNKFIIANWRSIEFFFQLYISSSSSSCRAASTDIPDPLSPLLPIIHRFWQVFRVTSRILT